jgi:dTMP kinase
MDKGIFITIEGMDGSGKSTQIELLKEFLTGQGRKVILTREPGGTRISEKIRDLLLDTENEEMKEETEILLYAASRAQHVREVIMPGLSDGNIIICDRYYDSSFAYQGYGRVMNLDFIKAANKFAIESARPDLTLFLDISPDKSKKRISDRANDRLENEDRSFHKRVYDGFNKLIEDEPERIKRINADRDIKAIAEDIKKAVQKKL